MSIAAGVKGPGAPPPSLPYCFSTTVSNMKVLPAVRESVTCPASGSRLHTCPDVSRFRQGSPRGETPAPGFARSLSMGVRDVSCPGPRNSAVVQRGKCRPEPFARGLPNHLYVPPGGMLTVSP